VNGTPRHRPCRFATARRRPGRGLAVKDPETAQIASTLPVLPLIFASPAFVPVATTPGWLQASAANQPVSVVINAVRALTQGGPAYQWARLPTAWSGGLLLVSAPLAVTRCRPLCPVAPRCR
jgi:ABC-2 type transport system permease protein